MNYHRDKESAWALLFSCFLIFLLSAIISSILKGAPENIPTPVFMATPSLGRSFLRVIFTLIKNLSSLGMAMGFYGIILWPNPR